LTPRYTRDKPQLARQVVGVDWLTISAHDIFQMGS